MGVTEILLTVFIKMQKEMVWLPSVAASLLTQSLSAQALRLFPVVRDAKQLQLIILCALTSTWLDVCLRGKFLEGAPLAHKGNAHTVLSDTARVPPLWLHGPAFLPALHGSARSLTGSPTDCAVTLSHCASLVGEKRYLSAVLICISLIMGKVEHLSIYLKTIFMSFSGGEVPVSFPHFLIPFLVFSPSFLRLLKMILETSALYL